MALACLLLAVEWGKQFAGAINQEIRENEQLASSRWTASSRGALAAITGMDVVARLEALVWTLCGSGMAGAPSRTEGMALLLDALIHGRSFFREWMIQIGWMIRAWLPVAEAVPLLLRNVADTLAGVRLSMGLAHRLCAADDTLEAFIAGFRAPEGFADQFAHRIAMFREEGFALSEMSLWELECRCRRMIEQAVLAAPGYLFPEA
jgi:hypothetical protein